jgi:hypothetical protein
MKSSHSSVCLFAAVLFIFATLSSFSATIDEILIKPDRLGDGCFVSDKDFTITFQARIHFATSSDGSFFCPAVEAKQFQSFECSGDKSTVYYFQYQSAEEVAGCINYIKGKIWGGDSPSKEHPELIFAIENILIVISSRDPEPIKALLIPPEPKAESRGQSEGLYAEPRSFDLVQWGALETELPAGWFVDQQFLGPDGVLNVLIRPPAEAELALMLSIFPTRGNARQLDGIRRVVERSASEIKKVSVEKELPIQLLEGLECQGFYFSATDRRVDKPTATNLKLMDQGMVAIGRL